MTRKLILVLLAGALVAVLAPMASADEGGLQVNGGTMELGGKMSYTYIDAIPDQGSSESANFLSMSPTIGYFVIKGLEVMASFGFTMTWGDLYKTSISNEPKFLGFGLGARYVLSLGKVAPYLGVLLGMSFAVPGGNSNSRTEKYFDFAFPVGVLIGLNQNVAIDLGLRIEYMKDLDNTTTHPGVDYLFLPVGYLGVCAFF